MLTIAKSIEKLRTTQAYQNFIAANPEATELPESVRAAINAELQQKAILENANNNGGNKPNRTLLIGGAIAAVALLILILKK